MIQRGLYELIDIHRLFHIVYYVDKLLVEPSCRCGTHGTPTRSRTVSRCREPGRARAHARNGRAKRDVMRGHGNHAMFGGAGARALELTI